MSTAPAVTIGLPVYNGANYLERALDSLLRQTFEDFELIVSDNGSTDETAVIAQQFEARDARVRYVRHPENRGASFNANFTVGEARGRYFKLASHDDEAAPLMLERCVEALDADPGAVLCYPRTAIIDTDSRLEAHFFDRMVLDARAPSTRFYQLVRIVDRCNPIFGLIRTEAFRSTRLFPPYVASDRVALAELALRGRFLEVPEHLFLRRMHPGISTVANSTYNDLVAWFDPAERNPIKRKRPGDWLFLEHVRAVLRAPISHREKWRSLVGLRRAWRRKPWNDPGVDPYVKRQKIRPIDDNDRARAFNQARQLLKDRKLDRAAAAIDVLAQIDPANPSVLGLQAALMLQRGDAAVARTYARAALFRSRESVPLFVIDGIAAAVLGDRATARRRFKEALARAPDSASAEHNLQRLRAAGERVTRLSDFALTLPSAELGKPAQRGRSS